MAVIMWRIIQFQLGMSDVLSVLSHLASRGSTRWLRTGLGIGAARQPDSSPTPMAHGRSGPPTAGRTRRQSVTSSSSRMADKHSGTSTTSWQVAPTLEQGWLSWKWRLTAALSSTCTGEQRSSSAAPTNIRLTRHEQLWAARRWETDCCALRLHWGSATRFQCELQSLQDANANVQFSLFMSSYTALHSVEHFCYCASMKSALWIQSDSLTSVTSRQKCKETFNLKFNFIFIKISTKTKRTGVKRDRG